MAARRERRAGGYQQHGGSGDQEIAGGSDPEHRVDAKGNAGDNGNARSENACSTVDAQNHGVEPVLIASIKRLRAECKTKFVVLPSNTRRGSAADAGRSQRPRLATTRLPQRAMTKAILPKN